MNHLSKSFTAVFISILFCSAGFSQDTPELLTSSNYFQAVRGLIQRAEKSIEIYMYFIIADPLDGTNPVNILLNDLISAKNKNVKITVYLEGSKLDQNKTAYKILTQNGINVKFDTPKNFLHAKTIIIDGRYCIIGSTNWSRSSIQTSRETNISIDSPGIAEAVNRYFSGLETAVTKPISEGVPVPDQFLLNPRLGPEIFKDHAQKALDLYLLLLRQSWQDKSPEIAVNYGRIAKELGYSPGLSGYYLKLRKPFRLLKSRYVLINYGTLRDGKISLQPIQSESTFTIPYGYWEYGYSKKLSFRAKYVYLIALLESQKRMDYPFWFYSNKGLSSVYHISENPVSLGFLELEKENMVEVARSKAENQKYEDRSANIYRLNPLISPDEYCRRTNYLMKQYGPLRIRQAKYFISRFNDPKDTDKLEEFAILIKQYGYTNVFKAVNISAGYKKGTSLNSAETVHSILES